MYMCIIMYLIPYLDFQILNNTFYAKFLQIGQMDLLMLFLCILGKV